MGTVVILPVIRHESEGLAAQERRRMRFVPALPQAPRLDSEALERSRRRAMVDLPSDVEPA